MSSYWRRKFQQAEGDKPLPEAKERGMDAELGAILSHMDEANRLLGEVRLSIVRLLQEGVLTEADRQALLDRSRQAENALGLYRSQLQDVIGAALRRAAIERTPPQLRPYLFERGRLPRR